MIGIFKQKSPANIFLLLVFGVLIKLPMFLHPYVQAPHPFDGKLFYAIYNLLFKSGAADLTYPLLAFALLFLQAIMLTGFMNEQRMMNKSNYLPGMAYLIITSLRPEWNYFSAALLVNSILIFVLAALFKIYNQKNAKVAIFNIGMALGIAGFLQISSLIFIVWILLALAVMRPFRINELILFLLGTTTPYYFYSIYIFFTDQWTWAALVPKISIGIPPIQQSGWLAGSVFLLMMPFLAGGYYVQDSLRRMLIHVRKGWSLLLLFLLTALFLPFVNNSDTLENWVMVMLPMAAFHSCTYLYAKLKILPIFLFWLSIAFILVYQYYQPGW